MSRLLRKDRANTLPLLLLIALGYDGQDRAGAPVLKTIKPVQETLTLLGVSQNGEANDRD